MSFLLNILEPMTSSAPARCSHLPAPIFFLFGELVERGLGRELQCPVGGFSQCPLNHMSALNDKESVSSERRELRNAGEAAC